MMGHHVPKVLGEKQPIHEPWIMLPGLLNSFKSLVNRLSWTNKPTMFKLRLKVKEDPIHNFRVLGRLGALVKSGDFLPSKIYMEFTAALDFSSAWGSHLQSPATQCRQSP